MDKDKDDGVSIKATMSDKINRFLKDWIIDIVIVIMLLVYVLKSVVAIEVSDKDILSILGDSALILVFMATIKSLMMRKGIQIGCKSAEFLAVRVKYEEKYSSVMDSKARYLSDYIEIYNERLRKEELTEILGEYALNYEMYINQSSYELNKLQQQGVAVANKFKATRLTTSDLTNKAKDSARGKGGSGLGKNIDEFVSSKKITDVLLTLVSVMVFAWFTVKLVSEFSWANVIWQTIQVVVFLIKGTLSFVTAYMFVTEEYRNRIVRQHGILVEFDNTDTAVYESHRAAKLAKAEQATKELDIKASDVEQTYSVDNTAIAVNCKKIEYVKSVEAIDTASKQSDSVASDRQLEVNAPTPVECDGVEFR